jgi:hypothetical protein
MMPAEVYKYMSLCTQRLTFFLTNRTGNTIMLPVSVVHGCVYARVYISPLSAFETVTRFS